MAITVTAGVDYNCKYPCFHAAADAYAGNGIGTVLADRTPEEWIELCEAGLPGYDRLDKPEPGALLVFHYRDKLWHVGVYLGCDKFFHIRKNRTAIERLNKYSKSLVGAYKCQI